LFCPSRRPLHDICPQLFCLFTGVVGAAAVGDDDFYAVGLDGFDGGADMFGFIEGGDDDGEVDGVG